MISEKALDARARRAAARVGLYVKKSRRYRPPDNFGGYIVLDPDTGFAVAGFKCDFDAEDVIAFCESDE